MANKTSRKITLLKMLPQQDGLITIPSDVHRLSISRVQSNGTAVSNYYGD